jgi:hypothetical protein
LFYVSFTSYTKQLYLMNKFLFCTVSLNRDFNLSLLGLFPDEALLLGRQDFDFP